MYQLQHAAEGTTAEFAVKYLVKPNSVRTRYCLTGSYFGIVPKKLPNGRLAWPLPDLDSDSKEVA